MPRVYAFNAIQFAEAITSARADISARVAPPYDVLDAGAKSVLEGKSDLNIVSIDLPHIPAKELGPQGVYDEAAARYRGALESKQLVRREAPAMFVYRETFEFPPGSGLQHKRTGMACTVETVAFGPREGGGILPHEETFSGPKEDRFALMKATRAQLSPIFGLHADAGATAAGMLNRIADSREPDFVADMGDGVKHECWTIDDTGTIGAYQDALAGEDVFIADGHHRYNTALRYLDELGDVPSDHPARRTMIVLVSMSDPGMVIGPTHRVLGGMASYSFDGFAAAAQGKLELEAFDGDLHALDGALNDASHAGSIRVGLYDFASRACFVGTPSDPDPLKGRFADKPEAWRKLDVAVTQHLVVEDIAQPALNSGEPIKWAFPHSIEEVLAIGAGEEKGSGGGKSFTPQLAVILRPTPLDAVRDVSNANELMPQKSTFFYPKLATGLFINPLD